MSATKKITVSVVIPVSVQLEVSWDGDETVIHKVELNPFGQTLGPRDIHENVDEDTADLIDKLTKEALGIEEDAKS